MWDEVEGRTDGGKSEQDQDQRVEKDLLERRVRIDGIGHLDLVPLQLGPAAERLEPLKKGDIIVGLLAHPLGGMSFKKKEEGE